jgi:hypothetical protein
MDTALLATGQVDRLVAGPATGQVDRAAAGLVAEQLLTDPLDCAEAARALADGAVIGHGFANFYAMTARADRDSVRRVNEMKGRPPAQIGSITVPPSRIAELFDWAALPSGLTRRSVLGVMDALYSAGPFGFRGPAAADLPEHLTCLADGVLTAQVIAPGYACPSNPFLARCLDATGDDWLYTTSANRSRHLTGADDSPAHWRAAGLRAEFGHEPRFALLKHADEDAARAAYPRYLPMSTTILGFHRLGTDGGDPRPQFVLDRHGSLHVDDVRQILDRLGFGLAIGPRAGTRLTLRDYGDR